MRPMAVVALLLAAALAGCAGDETPEETNVDTPQDVGDVAGNAPPLALLNATVLNGTAPLQVNFTLDGADADGDNLTWVLQAALVLNGTLGNATQIANGTTLPAAANYTFSPGLWNVTFAVTDGGNETVTTLQINVTAVLEAPPRVPVLLEEVTNHGLIGGPYVLTNDPDMAHQCPGFNAGMSGYGCVFLDFSNELAGSPVIITSDTANVRLAIWDECDPLGHGVGFHGGASGDQFTLPEGSGCIVAWSSNTGDWGEDHTFTLSIYDWLPE